MALPAGPAPPSRPRPPAPGPSARREGPAARRSRRSVAPPPPPPHCGPASSSTPRPAPHQSRACVAAPRPSTGPSVGQPRTKGGGAGPGQDYEGQERCGWWAVGAGPQTLPPRTWPGPAAARAWVSLSGRGQGGVWAGPRKDGRSLILRRAPGSVRPGLGRSPCLRGAPRPLSSRYEASFQPPQGRGFAPWGGHRDFICFSGSGRDDASLFPPQEQTE